MCAPLQGPDGGTDAGAPAMLAHNGHTFSLPPDIRDNLVLLLWPDNLPAGIGTAVPVWLDQSGHGNDAQANYPTAAPPRVIADGVQLDPTQYGSGFVVADSPSLDLGSGDFAVIVVAGLAPKSVNVTLFSKSDAVPTGGRSVVIRYSPLSASTGVPQGIVDDTQIVSDSQVTEPSVNVYGLRRVGDHVDLRLNGGVLKGADLPAGTSTTSSENLYLGTANLGTFSVDSIEAVIVVRGPTTNMDLDSLESFLTFFRMPS